MTFTPPIVAALAVFAGISLTLRYICADILICRAYRRHKDHWDAAGRPTTTLLSPVEPDLRGDIIQSQRSKGVVRSWLWRPPTWLDDDGLWVLRLGYWGGGLAFSLTICAAVAGALSP